MKVAAVILAAGAGARMGGPKALLPLGDQSFVSRAVRVASEVADEVIVVVGHGADAVRAEIPEPDVHVHIVANPDPDRGQLSSLQVGAYTAMRLGMDGILVWPVDHPAIDGPLVARVVTHATANPGCIVIPVHGGHGGHPSYVPKEELPALMGWQGEDGARGFFHSRGGTVRRLEVPEEGSQLDIDTPEDYRRIKGDEA